MFRILLKILTNKYFITILAFAIWLIFFDNNSLKRQRQLNRQVEELKHMKAYYEREIAKNEKSIHELETNLETLEKYAREKYLMKRDSEDVFVMVSD